MRRSRRTIPRRVLRPPSEDVLPNSPCPGVLVTFYARAAQAHYSQCPSGHFCIWRHGNCEGRFVSSPNGTTSAVT
jgi:hypothetical protein